MLLTKAKNCILNTPCPEEFRGLGIHTDPNRTFYSFKEFLLLCI